MSALLTEAMCERAWSIVLQAIRAAANAGVIDKYDGTIIVLDPTVDYFPASDSHNNLLFVGYVHPGVLPALNYDVIARAKAHLSWRTGRSSREVQQASPHMYKAPINSDLGDVKWGGSVVRDGLVVAFSGVQAVFDEWIAGMMADLLIAMCRHEMTKPDGIMAADESFIDRNRGGNLAPALWP